MNIYTKAINYLNRRVFRTPGVEFLRQNDDIDVRKKYLNFWLKRSRKKKSFQKYFFREVSKKNSQISFKNENYLLNDEMLDSLSNNGLLIIENALPEKEREKIIEYFDELKGHNQYLKNWTTKPHNPGFFKEVNEMMGKTNIKNFEYLSNYSAQFTKEIYGKIVEPTVELRYLKQEKNKIEEKVKGGTYIHTDRFLPHFKIYYTPHEITINDAPLEYVLSSHKINNNFINFYLNTKSYDETDKLFKNFEFERKIVCVPKNTLYIALTNGFHKRSQFNNNSERSLVFLQYVEKFNKIDYLF